jgi:tRNA(Ser,Leu) C12 N-acetylase TAN1
LFNNKKYTEKLYPEALHDVPQNKEEEDKTAENKTELSIEKQLEQELEAIKTTARTKKHIFQSIPTSCKGNDPIYISDIHSGVIYLAIRHEKIEPVHFVKSILLDLEASKTQKTRFACRFVPVQITCAANIQDIEKAAKPFIDTIFNSSPSNVGKKVRYIYIHIQNIYFIQFAIVYTCRNNSSCKKVEITEKLFSMVKTPLNWVDLRFPDWVIIVEVVRKICCISITNEYTKLKKYNIRQVSMSEELLKAENEHKTAKKEEVLEQEEEEEEVEEEEVEDNSTVSTSSKTEAKEEEEEDISLFSKKNKRKDNSEAETETKKIKSDT